MMSRRLSGDRATKTKGAGGRAGVGRGGGSPSSIWVGMMFVRVWLVAGVCVCQQ